uniref:SKA2 domain-containing protein n=1 Tax=Heterorhabditis bacteriophora TaxID=37862 RepID=A0A1I7X7L9_HETBA
MSSTSVVACEAQCLKGLNKVYSDLLHLISSFEKGSGSELTVRLRHVEGGLEQLRDAVRQIPDIHTEEERQREKIASLYRMSSSSLSSITTSSTEPKFITSVTIMGDKKDIPQVKYFYVNVLRINVIWHHR